MSDEDRSKTDVDPEAVETATAGSAGGAILGGVIGLAVGGPLGAAVGVGVGTLAGAAIGYGIDYDNVEPEFRKHHESDPDHLRHPWEHATRAYRYGWESHARPEFQGKEYQHVRADLQKGWTGSGDFADYEPYVKHSWDRRNEARMQDGSFSTAAKE